jgi:hypothetical protein
VRDNGRVVGGRAVRQGVVLAGVLAAGLTLGAGGAFALSLTPEMEKLYSSVEISPPTATRMTVCYGFVCRRRLVLGFGAAERAKIMAMLAKGRASASEERKAIQQVFVWFDHRVGNEVGTSKRVANADFRAFDDEHNFDCFDTTRNAMSLLLVLQEWGALRHHTVSDPRFRGNLLVGQTPHNTAVIMEKAGGTKWVVDMWPTAYGQVPDVMTLDRWLDEN